MLSFCCLLVFANGERDLVVLGLESKESMSSGLLEGKRPSLRVRALFTATSILEAIVIFCMNTATAAESTGCGVDTIRLVVSPGRQVIVMIVQRQGVSKRLNTIRYHFRGVIALLFVLLLLTQDVIPISPVR